MTYNRDMNPGEDRFGFAGRFLACSDQELVAAFNKEVGQVGRMNDRVDFLHHLRQELLSRDVDCSAITNGRSLVLSHRVRLVDNKLV